MKRRLILAVDAMGGECAPASVIEGISLFCQSNDDCHFHLFGNKTQLQSLISSYPNLTDRYTLFHTEQVVPDDESPVRALKKYPSSSMRMAIEDVKLERAQGCISSGNTGALMVAAKLILGTIDGIKRPAIVSTLPNAKDSVTLLDMGANTECDETNLLQFAIMGNCFSQIIKRQASPRVGILNVGIEEHKGRDVEKKAFEAIKNSGLNFIGFVEPYQIFDGSCDVVVTDGFTGNIAIKIAESSVTVCKEILKNAFSKSLLTKLGALLIRGSLKQEIRKIDPKDNNGAMFIGVKGVVVKSHGSSDSRMFVSALIKAYNLTKADINKQVEALIAKNDKMARDGVSLISKIRDKLGI